MKTSKYIIICKYENGKRSIYPFDLEEDFEFCKMNMICIEMCLIYNNESDNYVEVKQ